jgi:hypothetical protein
VRLFKDKLKYWAAYNSLLRAQEHKIKIKGDADSLVMYYEQQEAQLRDSGSGVYTSWVQPAQAGDQALHEGLLALTRSGLHAVRRQLTAARLTQQAIRDERRQG